MQPANLWLSRYAKFVVAATFFLIFIGGMVTSLNAGLAVPDWPTTFGYNMFAFPISRWKGLVFWEHSHRVIASVLGMLTTGLAIWIWCGDRRAWVKKLGGAALVLVIAQGIMGGYRVTEISTTLAIIHGCTAQLFLCLLVYIALTLSPAWTRPVAAEALEGIPKWRSWAWVVVAAVFVQLILGAIMRHLHAGLAIPTFPLTPEGTLMPREHNMLVDIHFSHRFWAVVVTGLIVVLATKVLRAARGEGRFSYPAIGLLLLLVVQLAFGASIIWLARAPIPTSLHVLNGAAVLVLSVVLAIRASHFSSGAPSPSASRGELLAHPTKP